MKTFFASGLGSRPRRRGEGRMTTLTPSRVLHRSPVEHAALLVGAGGIEGDLSGNDEHGPGRIRRKLI